MIQILYFLIKKGATYHIEIFHNDGLHSYAYVDLPFS